MIPVQAQSADTVFSFTLRVDENGVGRVTIRVDEEMLARNGVRETWLAVPRLPSQGWVFDQPPRSFGTGALKIGGAAYPFYENLTVTPSPGRDVLLSYEFPYASLILEPEAILITPLIVFDQRFNGRLTVEIDGFGVLVSTSQTPVAEVRDGRLATLVFHLPSANGRVWLRYGTVSRPDLQEVTSPGFLGETPRRYADLMKGILDMYGSLSANLSDLFETHVKPLKVRFFLPESLSDGVEGFVNITSAGPGDIHINLLTLRQMTGYLEHVALHELIHHYLWSAGVGENVLWLHEGGANFFAAHFLMGKGSSPESGLRDALLLQAGRTRLRPGFVASWTPSTLVLNPTAYYAASFSVLYSLNQTYGFNLFERFFKYVRENNLSLRTTEQVIEAFAAVSGGQTDEDFRMFGFLPVRDQGVEPSFDDYQRLWTSVFLLVSLVGLIVTAIMMAGSSRLAPIRQDAGKLPLNA